MDRRDILRKCGAVGVAAGLGTLAGCTGGSDEAGPEPSLEVTNFDYEEDDSGKLVVTVTIENSGAAEGSGYLYVTVTAAATTTEGGNGTDGGDDEGDTDTVASRESREVTVPAGETTTLEIPFEFTVEQFHRRGNLDVDLRT